MNDKVQLAMKIASKATEEELHKTELNIKKYPSRLWYYRQGAMQAAINIINLIEDDDTIVKLKKLYEES